MGTTNIVSGNASLPEQTDTLISDDLLRIKLFSEQINEVIARDYVPKFSSCTHEVQKRVVSHLHTILSAVHDTTPIARLSNILSSGQLLYKKIQESPTIAQSGWHHDVARVLLLKSAPVIVRVLQQEIFTILDIIGPRLNYWVAQKHHTLSYLLHKSPAKWFAKETQAQEVNRHLHALRVQQEIYHQLLGRLARHVESFIHYTDASGHDAWLSQLVQLAHEIMPLHKKKAGEMTTIQQFLEITERLQKVDTTRMVAGSMDNHVVRHWIGYSLTAATILGSWWGICHYPNEINTFMTKMSEACVEYRDWQGKTLTQLKKLAFSNEFSQKDNSAIPGRKEEIETGFQEIFRGLTEQNLLFKLKEAHVLNEITEEEQKAFIDRVLNDEEEVSNLFNFLKVMLECPKYSFVWSSNLLDHIPPTTKKGIVTLICLILQRGKTWAQRTEQRMSLLIGLVGTLIGGVVLAGTGVGAWLLLRSRPHDFSILRTDLLEIDRILNNYDRTGSSGVNHSAITMTDWGKLLYNIHHMSTEVYYITEPDRWQFERDVRQLMFDSALDIHQRRELIKIMMQQYRFLHAA